MIVARNGGKMSSVTLSLGRISLNIFAMKSLYSNKLLRGFNPPFTALYSSVIN